MMQKYFIEDGGVVFEPTELIDAIYNRKVTKIDNGM